MTRDRGGTELRMRREVLLLVEAEIATVQLIRRLLKHLEHTAGLRWRARSLTETGVDDLTSATFPLLVRSCNPDAAALAASFSKAGIGYGFYLDDNFWKLDVTTELGRHYAAPATRRRLESIVRGADLVIAATEPLREFLTAYSGRVVQLDSFYDFALAPVTLSHPPRRSTLRGGFAASIHRGDDLAEVMPAVLRALEEHPELEFEIIGAELAQLAHPRISWFPYQDSYAEYTRFQRSRRWDFGLAPLGGAESNLYKTDNKYREYAALGIPGIYADEAPYRAVRDGVTGLLAGRDRTWWEAIERYCTDEELRLAVRANARRDAEERVAIDVVAERWREVLDAAPAVGSELRPRVVFAAELARRRSPPRRLGRRVAELVRAAWSEQRENGLRGLARRSWRFVGTRVRRARTRAEEPVR